MIKKHKTTVAFFEGQITTRNGERVLGLLGFFFFEFKDFLDF